MGQLGGYAFVLTSGCRLIEQPVSQVACPQGRGTKNLVILTLPKFWFGSDMSSGTAHWPDLCILVKAGKIVIGTEQTLVETFLN